MILYIVLLITLLPFAVWLLRRIFVPAPPVSTGIPTPQEEPRAVKYSYNSYSYNSESAPYRDYQEYGGH